MAADESDIVVIEGLRAFNQPLSGMAVYATSATTRNLQIQQRQEKSSRRNGGRHSGSESKPYRA